MSYLKELLQSLPALPGAAPHDPQVGVVVAMRPAESSPEVPVRSIDECWTVVPESLRLTEAERLVLETAEAMSEKAREVARVEQQSAPMDRRGPGCGVARSEFPPRGSLPDL